MACVVWLPPDGQAHGRFRPVWPQVISHLSQGTPRHLGGNAMAIAHRLGAQIADAGLDVEFPVRLNDEQPVESDRAADKATGGHSDAARLGAAALGQSFALVPTKRLVPLVERFFNERAGDVEPLAVGQRRTDGRFALRHVDPVNRHLIDAQFPRSLGDDRFHQHDALESARLALRNARRSVGQHRKPAPAHGRRLIHQRNHAAALIGVALRIVRAAVANHEHVDGGDPAVLSESHFQPPVDGWGARGRCNALPRG